MSVTMSISMSIRHESECFAFGRLELVSSSWSSCIWDLDKHTQLKLYYCGQIIIMIMILLHWW